MITRSSFVQFSIAFLLDQNKPSWLGMQNTLTASLQRGKIIRPGYDTKQSDPKALAMLELLGNTEYPFIAITPRSTLAWSGSSW